MSQEIERKFLVTGEAWRNLGKGILYRQGYIRAENQTTTVRVRVAGEQGYLTLKGKTRGIARAEFEYPIPVAEAQQILDELCDRPLVEKFRYRILQGELTWEVDEFLGDNEGLILAEVELTHEAQQIELPSWIGLEVSDDLRYYNVNLAKHPYKTWEKS